MRTFKRKDCFFTRGRSSGLDAGAWPIAAGTLAMLFSAGLALPARGGPPADEVPDFAVRVRVIKADGAAPAADDAFTVGLARSVPLELQKGADVRATFADGAPFLTEKPVKRGCILRFACFPGISYARSGMKGTLFIESAMTAAWRELIVEPVRKGDVTLPVIVDRPRIEAPALYSDRGVAVTLLNWNGVAQSNVTVVVRTEREPARVVSARSGPLRASIKAVQNGPFAFEATTTVDLDGVDVLSVYWR